jgi:hypothetical protein
VAKVEANRVISIYFPVKALAPNESLPPSFMILPHSILEPGRGAKSSKTKIFLQEFQL